MNNSINDVLAFRVQPSPSVLEDEEKKRNQRGFSQDDNSKKDKDEKEEQVSKMAILQITKLLEESLKALKEDKLDLLKRHKPVEMGFSETSETVSPYFKKAKN